jgi:hypothetical protein
MVCATITRDLKAVDDEMAKALRDALHEAITDVFEVKADDVEMRVRETGALDLNSPPLAIDIDSGPGKGSWRIEECRDILLQLNQRLVAARVVPDYMQQKSVSNVWLRIFVKGASMPIGCPELLH